MNEVIDVCDPIVDIPTAFSPNGDGINDFLLIIGSAVVDFEIRIYNSLGKNRCIFLIMQEL
ncbi:MAG: gliding motility-associated C-terminal domain-containing protein [Bacteroidetes bacterium]|nr:gliding motility-associated C-terminal domain-containing protein [Bacteroidota bacterium]